MADNSSIQNSQSLHKQVDGPPCLIVLGMAGAGKTSFVQVKLFTHIKAFSFFFIFLKRNVLAIQNNSSGKQFFEQLV